MPVEYKITDVSTTTSCGDLDRIDIGGYITSGDTWAEDGQYYGYFSKPIIGIADEPIRAGQLVTMEKKKMGRVDEAQRMYLNMIKYAEDEALMNIIKLSDFNENVDITYEYMDDETLSVEFVGMVKSDKIKEVEERTEEIRKELNIWYTNAILVAETNDVPGFDIERAVEYIKG